ncbi:MAG: 4Fe-4S binding protein [Firmicutes bacterium]|nr:4Fe-4S binding protein [Bacillota bacterium]
MPTYAGRLPNLMLPYLKEYLQGNGALAVPVVTFGNRNFDNSLIELRDLLETHGFHTIAAAACSCEHSFSYELGAGRPDEDDITEIRNFACRIVSKLVEEFDTAAESTAVVSTAAANAAAVGIAVPVAVPGVPAVQDHGGYYQPRDRHGVFIDIRKVKPLTDMEKCTQCRFCAEICPMGAIDPQDVNNVPGICIKCGACSKKCPTQAKYYEDPGYLYHKTELEEMYARRAANAFFL